MCYSYPLFSFQGSSVALATSISYQILSDPSSTLLSTFRFQFVAFVSATSISYQIHFIWSSTLLNTFFLFAAVVSATNDILSDDLHLVKYFFKYFILILFCLLLLFQQRMIY